LKGHRFMLVATDYFMKWTEAVPLKKICIPQTLTTDQGTSLTSGQVREFANSYKVKLLNSSPYYAQANGQADSSNKTFINSLRRK
jgi:hypothetical protein